MNSNQSNWLGGKAIAVKGITQVICFPFAGGGASSFASWRRSLSPELNLIPLCPPGRERRHNETPVTDADTATDQIAQEIIKLTDQPVVFFGHSLGAQLAFETAHKLRQLGGPKVALLVISGSKPPSEPEGKNNWHLLPDEHFIQEISRLGGTPDEVLSNKEMMDLFIPKLRADFALLASFGLTKRVCLSCPIIAFGGQDDPLVSPKELQNWSQETTDTFDSVIFQGKHFFIQESKKDVIRMLNLVATNI